MSYFRIIKRSTLIACYVRHPEAKKAVELWYSEIKQHEFKSLNELKEVFKSASIIAKNRVIFNVKGNDFRLVVKINFHTKQIFIIWFGTHREYDKIDAATISYRK
ncbi:MAG: type II toxin-antitoxin system HigB family toxin [Ignavibacteria bacterium]|nr:type II toxin-antitoxin system HigB family toxin [Ignavibacteria bacterium]